MTPKHDSPLRLLDRASGCRCANCPPKRVCAWACIQGASVEDILIGAVLEQSQDWALEPVAAGREAPHHALWESFNT